MLISLRVFTIDGNDMHDLVQAVGRLELQNSSSLLYSLMKLFKIMVLSIPSSSPMLDGLSIRPQA